MQVSVPPQLILDNLSGAVPLDCAGRPRPALAELSSPDRGVGTRAGVPAPPICRPCVDND